MAADPSVYRRWYPPLLTLAGFTLGMYGLRSLGASYAVTRWPVIPARVIQSSVETDSSGRFRARVGYEFFLAGRRYVGGGIDRPGTAGDASEQPIPIEQAAAIVALYPVGHELLAGYDPVDPFRSVLHPHFNWWTTAPTLAGALFGALGVMIWRQRRRAIATVSTP